MPRVEVDAVLAIVQRMEDDALAASQSDDAKQLPHAATYLKNEATVLQEVRNKLRKELGLAVYRNDDGGEGAR